MGLARVLRRTETEHADWRRSHQSRPSRRFRESRWLQEQKDQNNLLTHRYGTNQRRHSYKLHSKLSLWNGSLIFFMAVRPAVLEPSCDWRCFQHRRRRRRSEQTSKLRAKFFGLHVPRTSAAVSSERCRICWGTCRSGSCFFIWYTALSREKLERTHRAKSWGAQRIRTT